MKKLSKLVAVLLAVALVGVMFAGCGSSSSSASTAKSEVKEAVTEAASEVKEAAAEIDPDVLGKFEFSFTCHDPDTSAKVIYMKSLCDEVYEKTNGGVTMTMYTGGTLVASTDVATAVEDGTADIGWLYTTFFPGEFVYTDIVTMPMTFDTSIQADEVLLDLIANNAQADLFISIHCNAAENHSAGGTETWVMGLHKSEANLAVARTENAAMLKEKNYENNYEGYNPNSPEASIIFSLYSNAYLANSILLANKVQQNMISTNHFVNRGIKQAGFWVLYKVAIDRKSVV